jgi:hypothetical protein
MFIAQAAGHTAGRGSSHVLFALRATVSHFQAAGASQPDAVDNGGDELRPVVGLHLYHERRRHLRPVRQRRPAVPQVKWDRRRIDQFDALERSYLIQYRRSAQTSGLCYKDITIVEDTTRVVSK